MGFLGGIVGKIIGLCVLLVVVLVIIGVAAYASDYGMQASVKERRCADTPPHVVFQTRWFSMTRTVAVTPDQCALISPGNYVVFHIRSRHVIVYEREGGACVYDSAKPAC